MAVEATRYEDACSDCLLFSLSTCIPNIKVLVVHFSICGRRKVGGTFIYRCACFEKRISRIIKSSS